MVDAEGKRMVHMNSMGLADLVIAIAYFFIPLEMISVLAEYSSRQAAFPVKGPAVGLFADQEIRLIDGPLFVGEDYIIRREIAALAESRRTESYWVRTRIFDSSGKKQVAEMLLNHATLKHSYAGYAEAG